LLLLPAELYQRALSFFSLASLDLLGYYLFLRKVMENKHTGKTSHCKSKPWITEMIAENLTEE